MSNSYAVFCLKKKIDSADFVRCRRRRTAQTYETCADDRNGRKADMGLVVDGLDFFFFNDTATTEIYTLSLHDALPTSTPRMASSSCRADLKSTGCSSACSISGPNADRKSTRLNSSHMSISYAVFC